MQAGSNRRKILFVIGRNRLGDSLSGDMIGMYREGELPGLLTFAASISPRGWPRVPDGAAITVRHWQTTAT